ncbi:hypothetical protein M752DRAFT_306048 [Aspergillus phoenicis ATCC 13157]|uniref:Uncharacterized protein n=1 Tax=Aspergillus phoenicis ATCC 13157 TaxID=1353007 RepID=A0A370PX33_ASPPH|nr:hypothetical protein M752DRAFT_306048 [Aspergillus phoenicis ATCC 13157]
MDCITGKQMIRCFAHGEAVQLLQHMTAKSSASMCAILATNGSNTAHNQLGSLTPRFECYIYAELHSAAIYRTHYDSVDNIRQLQWLQGGYTYHSPTTRAACTGCRYCDTDFLLEEDLSLQIRDFIESTTVADDGDMTNFVSKDFVSVKPNIARFGSMTYEVVSWKTTRVLRYTRHRGRPR